MFSSILALKYRFVWKKVFPYIAKSDLLQKKRKRVTVNTTQKHNNAFQVGMDCPSTWSTRRLLYHDCPTYNCLLEVSCLLLWTKAVPCSHHSLQKRLHSNDRKTIPVCLSVCPSTPKYFILKPAPTE